MSTGLGFAVSPLSVAFTVFMSLLELLVAFLQAFVFTLLSAIYIGMATEEHHHAEEHH
jgi:F-type H+-transporting ATPase subunit a